MMQFFDIIKARFSPKHFWGENDITFYLSHKIYKFNFTKYIIIFILMRFKWNHIFGTPSPVYTK